MQTSEETVQEIYEAIEWGGQSDLAVDILNEYASQYNQLLLDEVNRLNGVVEKQGKVIKELRDE